MDSKHFTIFGQHHRIGSYILMMTLSRQVELSFGKFRRGKLFTLHQGNYIYIGSALGKETTGAPLARRILRHTSRSGEQPPHHIHQKTKQLLYEKNMTASKNSEPSRKKLRWHIDYLLDLPEAEITHIIIIRNPLRLEQQLSVLLEQLDETSLIAPRLGAQDTRNSTHLLRITNPEKVLDILRLNIPQMITR